MGITVKGVEKTIRHLDDLETKKGKRAQTALRKAGLDYLRIFLMKSPVDSGRFRSEWQLSKYSSPTSIAAVKLSNRTIYGAPLELGSKPGSRPWPSAGPGTVSFAGRIYSKQAPGGIVGPTLKERPASRLATDIMNAVFV